MQNKVETHNPLPAPCPSIISAATDKKQGAFLFRPLPNHPLNREHIMRRRGVHADRESESNSAPRPRFKLEALDLYAKAATEEDVQTSTGAGVSLIAFAIIAILVLSELSGWLWPITREHVTVDAAIEGRVRINFDISLHALRCEDVNLDAMDVAGEQQNGVDHDFSKVKILGGKPVNEEKGALPSHAPGALVPAAGALDHGHHEGSPSPLPADYCGPCYGARGEGVCCNTCDDVRNAYSERGWDPGSVVRDSEQCVREGRSGEGGLLAGPARRAANAADVEGCRLRGFLLVNKVAGNFHIAMGETRQRGAGHIHQFNPMAIADYNVSHTINGLSFGEPYSGSVNPLDALTHTPEGGSAVYMYYLKVVPTTVKTNARTEIHTYQYSVSSQMRPAIVGGIRQNVLPGLFFVYELTPYLVTVNQERGTLLSFLTGLCAILGGVVTLARLADTVLYKASGLLKKRTGVDSNKVVAAAAASFVSAASSAGAAAASSASKAFSGPSRSPMALHSDALRSDGGPSGDSTPLGKSA